MSLALPVGAVMNCADNTGAKNLYVISVKGIKGRLNRLPAGAVGDMVMATVKKGKPDLRKKGTAQVLVFRVSMVCYLIERLATHPEICKWVFARGRPCEGNAQSSGSGMLEGCLVVFLVGAPGGGRYSPFHHHCG
jgi:hypothetical protein